MHLGRRLVHGLRASLVCLRNGGRILPVEQRQRLPTVAYLREAAAVFGPTAGFVPTACIFRSGASLPCPTTYPTSSGTFYGVTDTRDCSPCTCGTPNGGSCSGDIAAYGDNACSGLAWTDFVLGSCQAHLALVPNPGSVQAVVSQGTGVGYTFTSANCAVASAPQPMSSVMQTGATTVCCE